MHAFMAPPVASNLANDFNSAFAGHGRIAGNLRSLPPDPVHTSVTHLLAKALSLPCSTAAGAFSRLVQPTARFQLALDALLPLLDSPDPMPQRILVSFILYALYSPHPISVNPFRSALLATFLKERNAAGQDNYGNEQLVWVLWKILKGDGNDIGPFSPSTLARSPLPPKLRAANLFLEDERSDSDVSDASSLTSSESPPSPASSTGFQPSEEDIRALSLLLTSRERVLSLSEMRVILPKLDSILFPTGNGTCVLVPDDIPPIVANNAGVAVPLLHAILSFTSKSSEHLPSPFITAVCNALVMLPPTLATFDVMGRILLDGPDEVRDRLVSPFLSNVMQHLAHWEADSEAHGDDAWEMGVRHFCRFYLSLVKHGIVAGSGDEATEMLSFALDHARFEEATDVYRVLVQQ